MTLPQRSPGLLALVSSVSLLLSGCELVAGLSGHRESEPRGAGEDTPDCRGKAGFGGGGACGGGSADGGVGSRRPGVQSSSGAAGDAGGVGEEGGRGGENGSGEAGESGSGPLVPPRSCEATAGCNGESACTTLRVPGGPFAMGRSVLGKDDYPGGANEQPEHPVTVSSFFLDKYEVTVGRFRQFVERYEGIMPARGVGAHPNVPGSGWKSEWDARLPLDRASLEASLLAPGPNCNDDYQTWTPAMGQTECLPINCIDWHLSFAFCVWDGGRLPTEAEWEFAAAGGDENRLFPWGSAAPDRARAVFGCTASGSLDCSPADIRDVGSTEPSGYGRFGHADLAGSLMERTRDIYDPDLYSLGVASGTDVVSLTLDTLRDESPARGGSYRGDGGSLRGTSREYVSRDHRWDGVGWRCARNP